MMIYGAHIVWMILLSLCALFVVAGYELTSYNVILNIFELCHVYVQVYFYR